MLVWSEGACGGAGFAEALKLFFDFQSAEGQWDIRWPSCSQHEQRGGTQGYSMVTVTTSPLSLSISPQVGKGFEQSTLQLI